MKRFHVHLAVRDLDESIAFYRGLFGAEPTVRKEDYAKWMIDEPRVNFAISSRANGHAGLDHLGLQADDEAGLEAIRAQFERADASGTVAETDAACCYARSNKHWLTDPQGVAWEAFHTLDSLPRFGTAAIGADAECCASDAPAAATKARTGCCAPIGAAAGDAAAKCC